MQVLQRPRRSPLSCRSFHDPCHERPAWLCLPCRSRADSAALFEQHSGVALPPCSRANGQDERLRARPLSGVAAVPPDPRRGTPPRVVSRSSAVREPLAVVGSDAARAVAVHVNHYCPQLGRPSCNSDHCWQSFGDSPGDRSSSVDGRRPAPSSRRYLIARAAGATGSSRRSHAQLGHLPPRQRSPSGAVPGET